MSELLLCPYCGGIPREDTEEQINEWRVYCDSCGFSLPVDVWNTRIIQWVSVDKRLPMDENEHHVMAKEELFVCKCIDETWWIWDDGIGDFRIFLDNVTHWLDDKSWGISEKH